MQLSNYPNIYYNGTSLNNIYFNNNLVWTGYIEDLANIIFDLTSDSATGISGDINNGCIKHIVSNCKRCLCKFKNSKLYYTYLGDTNSDIYKDTGEYANLYGGQGDVVVQIPELWVRNDAGNIYISTIEREDYEYFDERFLAAFKAYTRESTQNNGTGVIRSVVNVVPTKVTTKDNWISKASSKGSGFSIMDYNTHRLLALLSCAIYGTKKIDDVVGSNISESNTTGGTTSLGNIDTTLSTFTTSSNFLGLEDMAKSGVGEFITGLTNSNTNRWTVEDCISSSGDTEDGEIIPELSTYDAYINSQSDFDTMISSSNWGGVSTVAFNCSVTLESDVQFVIPPNITHIIGYNNSSWTMENNSLVGTTVPRYVNSGTNTYTYNYLPNIVRFDAENTLYIKNINISLTHYSTSDFDSYDYSTGRAYGIYGDIIMEGGVLNISIYKGTVYPLVISELHNSTYNLAVITESPYDYFLTVMISELNKLSNVSSVFTCPECNFDCSFYAIFNVSEYVKNSVFTSASLMSFMSLLSDSYNISNCTFINSSTDVGAWYALSNCSGISGCSFVNINNPYNNCTDVEEGEETKIDDNGYYYSIASLFENGKSIDSMAFEEQSGRFDIIPRTTLTSSSGSDYLKYYASILSINTSTIEADIIRGRYAQTTDEYSDIYGSMFSLDIASTGSTRLQYIGDSVYCDSETFKLIDSGDIDETSKYAAYAFEYLDGYDSSTWNWWLDSGNGSGELFGDYVGKEDSFESTIYYIYEEVYDDDSGGGNIEGIPYFSNTIILQEGENCLLDLDIDIINSLTINESAISSISSTNDCYIDTYISTTVNIYCKGPSDSDYVLIDSKIVDLQNNISTEDGEFKFSSSGSRDTTLSTGSIEYSHSGDSTSAETYSFKITANVVGISSVTNFAWGTSTGTPIATGGSYLVFAVNNPLK